MNPRNKSLAMLFSVLLIGMLLGALLLATTYRLRLRHQLAIMQPGVFTEAVLRISDPTSDQQRKAVEIIAGQTEDNIRIALFGFQKSLDLELDSMLIKLDPLINEEQINHLRRNIDSRVQRTRSRLQLPQYPAP